MPPKPARKASTSNKDATAKSVQNTSMPPPPDPAPPQGILEPEMRALSSCLRNAVVKTGQIYGFYADVRRLGIHKYAPYPPHSLTASLGREIEKYDQLCDAMESHLLRAIAVLQRDLSREEERLKAEAVATAAAKAPPVASSSMHTVSTPPASPPQSTKAMEVSTETSSTTNQTPKPSGLVSARRQSTISLSSLQRPPFPHKLDLSSSTLRMNPDEIVPSGLSSPVTLAPRSARTALPPDLVMAALNDAAGRPVDIDLTAGDTEMDMQQSGAASAVMTMDPSLGSSADKPIELDLEDIDMEFFANATEAGTDVGTDVTGGHFNSLPNNGMSNGQNPGSVNAMPKVEEDLFLNALNAVDNPGVDGDIFASLGDNSSHDRLSSSDSGSQRNPHFSSNLRKHSPGAAPSPASILASLGPSSNLAGPSLNSSGEAPFDLHNIDLSNLSHPNPGFFGDHPAEPEISIAEMESFFNMTDAGESNKESRAS